MRTRNMKKIVIIITAVLFFINGQVSLAAERDPRVENGVLDLSNWDFERNGPVKISGIWEFYWDNLLEPESFRNGSTVPMTGYISLPGSWYGYMVDGQSLGGKGYSTYRVKVKLNNDHEGLAIKTMEMCSSYNLYFNGQLVNSNGVVGNSKGTSRPQYLPGTADLPIRKGENEMMIQVSNFYQEKGGAWGEIVMGTKGQIRAMREGNIALELFLAGSILIMGLYHLIFYVFKKRDTAPLYFSMFCFLISLRTIITGERFFVSMFPYSSWEINFKIEYLTIYSGFALFFIFMYSLFRDVFHKKILRLVQMVGGIFSTIVIFTPAEVFTCTINYFMGFIFVIILYVIIRIIRALILRVEGSAIFLIGLLVLFCTLINDFLSASRVIYTRPLVSVGFLAFIFSQSVALSRRFSVAFSRAEELAGKNAEVNMELMELNANLEQKVRERTRELERKNELLNRLANSDGLTGLFNHKYMYTNLEREIEESGKQGTRLSVAMFDIDDFKLINDMYGHQTGDRILEEVAKILESALRGNDIVGRYGGEEFLAVLPGAGLKQAYAIVERISREIEQTSFKGNLHITTSGGVAESNGEGALKLVEKADRMLYEAKKKGKNRIMAYQIV